CIFRREFGLEVRRRPARRTHEEAILLSSDAGSAETRAKHQNALIVFEDKSGVSLLRSVQASVLSASGWPIRRMSGKGCGSLLPPVLSVNLHVSRRSADSSRQRPRTIAAFHQAL